MMEFISEYGMFLLKALTIVLSVLFLIAGVCAIGRKPKPKLEITFLNKHHEDVKHKMKREILGTKTKKKKKTKKSKDKMDTKPILYLIDFHGDMKATQVETLREEVTAILSTATANDEVLVRLESPGGTVNGYGLAASQLQRIRDRGVPLTVCVDKVAASGGYLMACVANQIIAAPFAILGSIGVVAQMPNFHRWLQKNNIDIELLTAGEYKRTLTLLGKNSDKGRQKFQEDLEDIHAIFRSYIATNRQIVDIDEVATGEHWLAKDAINLALVDKLQTSDEFIDSKLDSHHIYSIKVHSKPTLLSKVLKPAAKLLGSVGIWGHESKIRMI